MAEAEIERRYIRVGTSRVYYQEVGSGFPVILIHGLSGSGRWWQKNIRPLSERFHVYIVDLIGFGRSRGKQGFVLQEAAAHLTRWMDELELETVHVVGHSLGGVIALDLAAVCPDRVERLVLVEPALIDADLSTIEHVRGFLRALWHLPVSFLPLLVQDAWRAGPVSILQAARELLTTDAVSRLRRIQAPTLVVWGEYDTAVPRDVGRTLVREIPSSRLEVISGAGHNPMWDRSEAFNQIVLNFLS